MENLSKISVSIGVPAHNEEKNIGVLLTSINSQIEKNYILDSVYVFCDGCDDNTFMIASSFSKNENKIKVINDGKRLGKMGRLNSLFRMSNSDIVIFFDADVKMGSNMVIENFVKSFSALDVGLVGGLELPSTPHGFIQKIFHVSDNIWLYIRMNFMNKISVHNISGRIMGMSNKFYKNLVIPENIKGEDEFLFFEVYRNNLKFAFAQDAVIYFNLPITLNEYVTQVTRFINTKYLVSDYINQSLDKYYHIPFKLKIKALLVNFIKNPVLVVLAIILQVYVRTFAYFHQTDFGNYWVTAKSTK